MNRCPFNFPSRCSSLLSGSRSLPFMKSRWKWSGLHIAWSFFMLWEMWMPWFQDFSDDVFVFVFSSFLGAGFTFTTGKPSVFLKPGTSWCKYSEKLTDFRWESVSMISKGKWTILGFPKAEGVWVAVIWRACLAGAKPPVEDSSAILFEKTCHFYT